MQKSKVLTDNPQERLCCKLSWLAGFFDADGCVNIYRKYTAKTEVYTPRLVMTNTNKDIVDTICAVLREVSIPFYVQIRKNRSLNHNNTADIIISGYKRCFHALPLIAPYLKGKREKAELMLQFCELRLKAGKKEPYSIEQLSLCNQIKSLNNRGKKALHKIPRDYTLSSSYDEGEDIVRSCARA